jgi:hypothetical protein
MSSSISNSRRAFAIAALVLAAFGVLEVVTKRVLFASSKDLRRFSTYVARAQKLARATEPSIAFVGNSITERGVDPAIIESALDVKADVFVADDSHLNTWTWIVRSEFWKPHLKPDLVVVTFHARSLEDGRSIELGRIAQFFSTPSDWPELFDTTLTSLGDRAELVTSSYWATYAVRDRLKECILKSVPGYRELVAFEKGGEAGERTQSAKRVTASWKTLARFLDLARSNDTQVVFVAFPSRTDGAAPVPYDVPRDAVQLIQAAGMTFLDLRHIPELDRQKHYDDDIHLNADGRAVFTHRLGRELARLGLPRR